MTNLLEIKPYIHDFVEENLDSVFANKVYWLGERVNVPTYPYCLLNVIAENKDKRTSRHYGEITDDEKREGIVTRYKTCTITVGIYNAFVGNTYDSEDMDIAKEFAYEQIDLLEGRFEEYPINNMFSIQSISPIRPLPEVVDGGYMYRYEFDLIIGYNEQRITDKDLVLGIDVSVGVDKEIDIDTEISSDDDVGFIITVDNNDNIDIEYK